MLASGVGLVVAIAALWVQGWERADHRFFAALISIAVTLSLFSVVAWAAAAIAPLPLTWVLVGTLALLFALRLYRELREPPSGERSAIAAATASSKKFDAPISADGQATLCGTPRARLSA